MTPPTIRDMDVHKVRRGVDDGRERLVLKFKMMQISKQLHFAQAAILDECLTFCEAGEDIALALIEMFEREFESSLLRFIRHQAQHIRELIKRLRAWHFIRDATRAATAKDDDCAADLRHAFEGALHVGAKRSEIGARPDERQFRWDEDVERLGAQRRGLKRAQFRKRGSLVFKRQHHPRLQFAVVESRASEYFDLVRSHATAKTHKLFLLFFVHGLHGFHCFLFSV